MPQATPKMVAQSVSSLQAVVAAASAGLRIVVDNDEPIPEIGDVLSKGFGGNGMVHLILNLPQPKRTVELTLDRRYAITPQIRDTLDSVPGILAIEEI